MRSYFRTVTFSISSYGFGYLPFSFLFCCCNFVKEGSDCEKATKDINTSAEQEEREIDHEKSVKRV